MERITYSVWMTGITHTGKQGRELLYHGKSKDVAVTMATHLMDSKCRFFQDFGIEVEEGTNPKPFVTVPVGIVHPRPSMPLKGGK